MVDWSNLAQIASSFISVLAFATSIWAARSKKHEADLNSLRADIGRGFSRIDMAEQRLSKAESELAHLPNKDMVHDLRIGMAELKGQLGALVERIAPIARSLDRVEQSLIERNDK